MADDMEVRARHEVRMTGLGCMDFDCTPCGAECDCAETYRALLKFARAERAAALREAAAIVERYENNATIERGVRVITIAARSVTLAQMILALADETDNRDNSKGEPTK